MASLPVIAETVFRSRDSIERLVPRLKGLVEAIDLPESPLGLPMPSSIPLSVFLGLGYGVSVIPHVRLLDHNELGLISLIQGLWLAGVDKVLLTMGDKPGIGRVLCSWGRSEEAVEWIKRYEPGMNVGLIISLNYPFDRIVERLGSQADFFYVMYLSGGTMRKYEKVVGVAWRLGKKIMPYLIIRTRRNGEVIEHLGQPYVDIEDLEVWVAMLKDKADAVILSVPGDHQGLVEAVEIARRASRITIYTRPREAGDLEEDMREDN